MDSAKQSGDTPLNSLSTVRLVGSRNRKTVSPRTPNQLAYVKAIQENDVTSGLYEAEHALADIKEISFNRFSPANIVRHPIVEHIVNAYEKFRE